MNKEKCSFNTAEYTAAGASKSAKKPENTKCEGQLGYVFKKLRELSKVQQVLLKNQKEILKILKG